MPWDLTCVARRRLCQEQALEGVCGEALPWKGCDWQRCAVDANIRLSTIYPYFLFFVLMDVSIYLVRQVYQSYIHICIYGPIILPTCLLIGLSVYLSIYLSIHLSIYLSCYLSLSNSIHLSVWYILLILYMGPWFLSCIVHIAEARLESLYKLRQVSREWKKGLKGFEWLTTDEMKALGWPEILGCNGYTYIYIHMLVCIYKYLHRERERDIYTYIYMYTYVSSHCYVRMCVYIYICRDVHICIYI